MRTESGAPALGSVLQTERRMVPSATASSHYSRHKRKRKRDALRQRAPHGHDRRSPPFRSGSARWWKELRLWPSRRGLGPTCPKPSPGGMSLRAFGRELVAIEGTASGAGGLGPRALRLLEPLTPTALLPVPRDTFPSWAANSWRHDEASCCSGPSGRARQGVSHRADDSADAPATRSRGAGHRGMRPLTCPHLSLAPRLPRPRAGCHPAQMSCSPAQLLLLLPGMPRLLLSTLDARVCVPASSALSGQVGPPLGSHASCVHPAQAVSPATANCVDRNPLKGRPCGSIGKASACDAGDQGLIPGLRSSSGEGNCNPLQYSCLVIPWTEKPGGLQSMGSQRVGHD